MFNPEAPPPLATTRWFNSKAKVTLADLKGRVVVMAAFQMNCPGSRGHILPQLQRLSSGFNDDEVAVIGLHSVFEDRDAQAPDKLDAFIGEHKLAFPIAVDEPDGEDLPKTMAAYQIQGTPTLLIFDRQGRLRRHYLGRVDDLRLGAEVMALCMESKTAPREQSIAIEQRLAMALVEPDEHEHQHDGSCCGGHHDHGHDHGHHHAHEHKAEGGCDDPGCGCKH